MQHAQSVPNAPLLELRGLSFHYPNGPSFNFESATIGPGQVVVLVGASGSGKSTLMRLLRGELEPTSGSVHIAGAEVETRRKRLVLDERRAGWVPQSEDLQPMLRMEQNIAHHLLRLDEQERNARVEELSKAFHLDHLLGQRTSTLSGGQRQRVSIAKAMAGKPPVLLMDESLAQLDLRTKTSILLDLKQQVRRDGSAALLVLHDPADAQMVADQVWVMHGGTLAQQGSMEEVLQHPVSYEVAGLFWYINVVPVHWELPGKWTVQGDEKWNYAHELALGPWATEVLPPTTTVHGKITPVRFKDRLLLCGA